MDSEIYSQELCHEKHANIEKTFAAVWNRIEKSEASVGKRMNGLDKKLWAVILLLLANLLSIVVGLAFLAGK